MRCSFCGRRIRGDHVRFPSRSYHYATGGPRRHCHAAAVHYQKTSGIKGVLYTVSGSPEKETKQ